VGRVDELKVAVVGAWTSDGLARRVKRLLVDESVEASDVVSVSHGRTGIFGAAVANGPLSALVVWRSRAGTTSESR
jgi:hypothetical protein